TRAMANLALGFEFLAIDKTDIVIIASLETRWLALGERFVAPAVVDALGRFLDDAESRVPAIQVLDRLGVARVRRRSCGPLCLVELLELAGRPHVASIGDGSLATCEADDGRTDRSPRLLLGIGPTEGFRPLFAGIRGPQQLHDPEPSLAGSAAAVLHGDAGP